MIFWIFSSKMVLLKFFFIRNQIKFQNELYVKILRKLLISALKNHRFITGFEGLCGGTWRRLYFLKLVLTLFLYVFERVKNLYGRFQMICDIMKYPNGGTYGGPCCGAVRWGGTVGRYCGGVRKTKCLPVMFFYSLASNIQWSGSLKIGITASPIKSLNSPKLDTRSWSQYQFRFN